MPHTLVCFHAHPDDEALLTAGTMAKAAAAGHRVVLVAATRGEVGDVAADFLGDDDLGERRWHELEAAAATLGVARLEWLGYADSGSGPAPTGAGTGTRTSGPCDHVRFCEAEVEEAAARLAEILRDERADVLTSYDPNGGYGHPDHVQVHRVGARAAELAGTPVVLEATVDRELMHTGVEMAQALGYEVPSWFAPETVDVWYTPSGAITHIVDVSAHLEQKKAAMQAHASQATAADAGQSRTLDLFLGLPDDLFALGFGTEWFVARGDGGRRGAGVPADDVFADLDGRA
jgi:LmbE family N-acetylglucosaminyl deacetylase